MSEPVAVAGPVPWLYLDANILLPQYLRAVFLDLADAGLVRVHWGRQVLAEVHRNLVGRKLGNSAESASLLLANMARAFPDALVPGSEALEPLFRGKTDPKDAHVAAGALWLSQRVRGGHDVILVTSNIRHLPPSAFKGMRVRPAHPNFMLQELLAADHNVAHVLARMVARFKSPRMSREDLLTILDVSNCRGFATALGHVWGLSAQT